MPKDKDRKSSSHSRSHMHEGHRSTGSANRKSTNSSSDRK
jgi:hypothetical protein